MSGVVEREKMGSEITAVFDQLELGMNFSTYRHHQTGLLKKQCNDENDFDLYSRLFGENDFEQEGEQDDEEGFEDLTPLQEARFRTAAHTEKTAWMAYAACTSKRGAIHLEKSIAKLEINRRVAKEWHIHLGLVKRENEESSGNRKKPTNIGGARAQQDERGSANQQTPRSGSGGSAGGSIGTPLIPTHVGRVSFVYDDEGQQNSEYSGEIATGPTNVGARRGDLMITPPVNRRLFMGCEQEREKRKPLDPSFTPQKGLERVVRPDLFRNRIHGVDMSAPGSAIRDRRVDESEEDECLFPKRCGHR